MNRVRIPRTGLPDLEFVGERIAFSTGADEDGATRGRCHHITVYRAEDCEYVVAVDYHTELPDENPDHFVEIATNIDDVDAALSLYEPTARLAIRPTDVNDKQRQTMLSTMTRRYDLQVHAVLQQLQKSAVAMS